MPFILVPLPFPHPAVLSVQHEGFKPELTVLENIYQVSFIRDRGGRGWIGGGDSDHAHSFHPRPVPAIPAKPRYRPCLASYPPTKTDIANVYKSNLLVKTGIAHGKHQVSPRSSIRSTNQYKVSLMYSIISTNQNKVSPMSSIIPTNQTKLSPMSSIRPLLFFPPSPSTSQTKVSPMSIHQTFSSKQELPMSSIRPYQPKQGIAHI